MMIMIYDEDDTDVDDDGDDYDYYICHSYARHNDGIILALLLPPQMTTINTYKINYHHTAI